MAELSLAELSAYFWLNCLIFKSAELSLAKLSGRGVDIIVGRLLSLSSSEKMMTSDCESSDMCSPQVF